MFNHVIESRGALELAICHRRRSRRFRSGRGATEVRVTTVEEKISHSVHSLHNSWGNPKGGGKATRTLGVIGNLGGVAGYPEIRGLVSDADGAVTALAVALRLLHYAWTGESLDGDVIVATHICTTAPTIPHEPVPFMGNPTFKAITKTLQLRRSLDAGDPASRDVARQSRRECARLCHYANDQGGLHSSGEQSADGHRPERDRTVARDRAAKHGGPDSDRQWSLSPEWDGPGKPRHRRTDRGRSADQHDADRRLDDRCEHRSWTSRRRPALSWKSRRDIRPVTSSFTTPPSSRRLSRSTVR